MGKKSAHKKSRLAHALKQNRRLPIFVVAKTNRRVSQNNKRRNWRKEKMGIEG